MGGTGRNNRAVYKPAMRRSVFRLCIKMTDNGRNYAGRLESSRCGDNDASLQARDSRFTCNTRTLTLLLAQVTRYPHTDELSVNRTSGALILKWLRLRKWQVANIRDGKSLERYS